MGMATQVFLATDSKEAVDIFQRSNLTVRVLALDRSSTLNPQPSTLNPEQMLALRKFVAH